MFTLTLGGFLQGFLATIFVVLCLLLSLIILIQKPRGGGLSGAFGGAGGGGQMFGGKSGDVLTWITVSFFVLFLLVGMGLVVTTRSEAREGQQPAPPAAATSAEVPEAIVLPPLESDSPPETATPPADREEASPTNAPEVVPEAGNTE